MVQNLVKLSTATALFGVFLQGSFARGVYGQDRSLTLSQQIDQLQLAVCQQNWGQAVALVSPIIASSQITDADRSEYVRYRQTLESYQYSNARFESMPGCEDLLARVEAQKAMSPPEPDSLDIPATSTSSFDWDSAVRRMESQSTVSNSTGSYPSTPSTASSRPITPSFPTAALNSENNTEKKPSFQPSQGIFFYNSQFGDPARTISGYLVSTMPTAVDSIQLVYDVFRQVEGEGVNAGTDYVYSFTDSMSVSNRAEQGQQLRFALNQEEEFYRIVGIGWLENGERAYTFLHESEGGQSGVCSQLWPYSYSCNGARQAKNPGF